MGRSCIEVRAGGERYLLDCGVKFHNGGLDYPAKVFESRTINGVFLSHAHLDHSGGLPFFEHYRMHCPIFCTPETKEMTKILLKDSHRIARIRHSVEAFTKFDMKSVMKDITLVRCEEPARFRSVKHTFYNSGHIPGACSVKLEADGYRILYTGDYNTVSTALMHPADPHAWGEVDILITESTYGIRTHPDRKQMRDAFLKKVQRVVERGGRVLVPVFAVGRAQDILLMLSGVNWNVPIYMDGMAKRITRIVMEGPSPYTKGKSRLREMYRRIKVVKNPRERERIADGPGIFVSTSGMLQGGPAMSYLEHLHDDPKSAVLLTGYQVKGTNGWHLDQEGVWPHEGKRIKVQCEVDRFDFSAHLSRDDIKATILATKPKVIIFNHGDPRAITAMREWAEERTQAAVFTPKVGEQIEFEDGKARGVTLYTQDDGYDFPKQHQHPVDVEDDD